MNRVKARFANDYRVLRPHGKGEGKTSNGRLEQALILNPVGLGERENAVLALKEV